MSCSLCLLLLLLWCIHRTDHVISTLKSSLLIAITTLQPTGASCGTRNTSCGTSSRTSTGMETAGSTRRNCARPSVAPAWMSPRPPSTTSFVSSPAAPQAAPTRAQRICTSPSKSSATSSSCFREKQHRLRSTSVCFCSVTCVASVIAANPSLSGAKTILRRSRRSASQPGRRPQPLFPKIA